MNKVEFEGVGTHSGDYCSVKILPARSNYGIKFFVGYSEDAFYPISANVESVSSTVCSTTISNSEFVQVATVEHLMSALAGCGIFNAKIFATNKEIPILDGSAKEIVEKIKQSGIKKLRSLQKHFVVKRDVVFKDGDNFLMVSPSRKPIIDLELRFQKRDNMILADQAVSLELSEESFVNEISYARTFGFFSDMAKLQAMNLIKGTSLDNAVVIGADGAIINESGLRNESEFVRHKVLDLIGDFAMLGMPILAKISGNCSSHTLNNKLLKMIMADELNYEIVEFNNTYSKASTRFNPSKAVGNYAQ